MKHWQHLATASPSARSVTQKGLSHTGIRRSAIRSNVRADTQATTRAGSQGWRWGLGLGLLQLALALSPHSVRPTQAAETITFSLGATIERSISVASLEIYVTEGRITDELAPYIPYINDVDPEALESARTLLSQRADLDVVTVSQFAYTPQGEYLLDEIGKVFRTGARLPGGKGLRGAAILAAADDETGLTILNVIKRFPTPVLRVDLQQGLAIANQTSESFKQTQAALDLVEQLSLQTTTNDFPAGTSAADLNELATQPGLFRVSRFSVRVKASTAPVDIYLPRSPSVFFNEVAANNLANDPANSEFRLLNPFPTNPNLSFRTVPNNIIGPMPKGLPTVIISHGFGNERKTYRYLAEFLAARGFAVISVEHPGSSAEQFNALVTGRTGQVVPDDEFINRPAMISQVLDELSARADGDKIFAQVDFNNVGIVGQSFGGYTALAVAGAPVNLASLRANCPPEFSVNISVLLQCQAAGLPFPVDSLDFYDPRIRAVVAINPVTSLIFGKESLAQVNVPVLMIAGSGDTVAPALPEQVRPFTWLTMAEKYLLVMEGGTHFSTIGVTGEETFQLPPEIFGPVPEVAQGYTQVMSLAFFSTYLRGDQRYQPILSSRFTTTQLGEPEMPLSIVPGLDGSQLRTQLRLAAEGALPERQVEKPLDRQATDETLAQELPEHAPNTP